MISQQWKENARYEGVSDVDRRSGPMQTGVSS
jgi:hypothetical protein